MRSFFDGSLVVRILFGDKTQGHKEVLHQEVGVSKFSKLNENDGNRFKAPVHGKLLCSTLKYSEMNRLTKVWYAQLIK